MVFADTVTLINRTSKRLPVRFDGRDEWLEPGENPGVPRAWIPFAKTQNVLMGSQDPFNPTKYISLVGVKDTKDDCTPIEQNDQAPQRIDRSGDKRRGRASKVVEADGPNAFDARSEGPAGMIEGFTGRR